MRSAGVFASGVVAMVWMLVVGESRADPQPPEEPARAAPAELLGIKAPGFDEAGFDDARAAGLPQGSKPEVLTAERAFAMALSGGKATRLKDEDFDRFRKAFFAARDGKQGDFHDPSGNLFRLLARVQAVENARRFLAELENLEMVVQELVKAEAGLSRLSLDRLMGTIQDARLASTQETTRYRDALDVVKVELGVSPRTPLVVDRGSLKPFHEVFAGIAQWFTNPARKLDDLPAIVNRLPALDTDLFPEFSKAVSHGSDSVRLEDALVAAAKLANKFREGTPRARNADDERQRELLLRQRVRRLAMMASEYSDEKQLLLVAIRLKDRVFEELVSPPEPGASRQSIDLTTQESRLLEIENRLVDLWAEYSTEALALRRDLGTWPYKDWTTFLAQFTPVSDANAKTPAAAAPPPPPERPAPAPPSLIVPR